MIVRIRQPRRATKEQSWKQRAASPIIVPNMYVSDVARREFGACLESFSQRSCLSAFWAEALSVKETRVAHAALVSLPSNVRHRFITQSWAVVAEYGTKKRQGVTSVPQFPGISSLCVRPQGPLEAEPPVAPTSLALKVLAFGLLVALDGGQEMLLADAHQASVAGGVPLVRET